MSKVALFHLSSPIIGGRMSYTYYLAQSMKDAGLEPEIYEVKSRNEKAARVFAGEWPYRNVTLKTAVQIANSVPSLITALDKHFYEPGMELLNQKAALTVHKHGKLTPRMIGVLKGCKTRVIAPSSALAGDLVDLGIDATAAPYPYPFEHLPARERPLSAVSMGRLERNRGFKHIFRVNKCLKDTGLSHQSIATFGEENRVFTYKEITPIVPEWRELGYSGTFEPGTGASIAADAAMVIDLREEATGVISYPIIEAWAGGATPMVSELRYSSIARFNNLYESGNFFFELYNGDEKALASRIASGNYRQIPEEDRIKILQKHLPSSVIPSYIRALHIK